MNIAANTSSNLPILSVKRSIERSKSSTVRLMFIGGSNVNTDWFFVKLNASEKRSHGMGGIGVLQARKAYFCINCLYAFEDGSIFDWVISSWMMDIVSCIAVQYGWVETSTRQCGKKNGFVVSVGVGVDGAVLVFDVWDAFESTRPRVGVELLKVSVEDRKLFWLGVRTIRVGGGGVPAVAGLK